MGTGDEVDGVGMGEGLGDVGSEEEASTARGKTPAFDVVGIRP